jgi:adenine-specific DNA methylase
MGAAHEQPESASRGTGADGADLQLSFLDAVLPTEAQQIEKIDRAESEKTPSAFVLSQAEIKNELRKHGSGFTGGKQRIMALYQTQPDRKLRAKALAKEYGIGGHSHDFLDGSRGFVNHDWKGLEFDHYPDHQKITLKWAQVEKYIDLMIQSDRYLTDKEKEHYAPLALVSAKPDATLTRAKNLLREFCQEEYDSEPDFSDLSKIGIAYTHATDEDIPIQVNVDLVGYRVERYLGEVLIDERQYESLEDLTETELEALDFSELISVTDEELEHYHSKAKEYPALLPLGTTIHMEGRAFRVDSVNFDKDSVSLQDVALAEMRMPVFRQEPLAVVRSLYEQEQTEPELSDEELGELPISTVIDGEVQTFPDAAALDEALNAVPAGNFRITDDRLGEGGAKQKYARNIEAIRTLFKLEQEHRGATAEEQQVLSQYVGWGGLADAFDPSKDSWAKEYAELKGLLSEDEYAAARSSTLNAHYTSPTVIRGIYDAVERMGFRSGNILEPSMGVGNFFGMLPDSMADSRLYGVELDSITGRIAKKLYPQADITVAGFETTDRRDFYDLAVGNVPFGQYKVNDKAYNKLGFSIHNYFFAKAIDQVRPGGVVAFVTSRYTLDSKDSSARKHMAERADLLGAIRLPNNAFRANAGTDVVSDIIFLQKRDRPADIELAWVQLGKTEDGFAINQYFVDHPEMVLGVLSTESTQYGREELTVAPLEGISLADQLAEAVQHIEGQYTEVEVETPDIADAENEKHILPAVPERVS